MNKRNSQKKIGGDILLKQQLLMSKFASLEPERKPLDDLGFALQPPSEEQDALLSLISKSKNITQQHAKQIEHIKKSQLRQQIRTKREGEGTFLTGLGLASEQGRRRQTPQSENIEAQLPQESDPDAMLKELIVRQSTNDLEQLRKLIRQTSSNLQGCSRKLNKNKKSILQMADRYSKEVPYRTLDILTRYEEFDANKMEEEEYYGRN